MCQHFAGDLNFNILFSQPCSNYHADFTHSEGCFLKSHITYQYMYTVKKKNQPYLKTNKLIKKIAVP